MKWRNQRGFVDILSLIALGFLVLTIFVGTAAVSNTGQNFDIRKSAKEVVDVGSTAIKKIVKPQNQTEIQTEEALTPAERRAERKERELERILTQNNPPAEPVAPTLLQPPTETEEKNQTDTNDSPSRNLSLERKECLLEGGKWVNNKCQLPSSQSNNQEQNLETSIEDTRIARQECLLESGIWTGSVCKLPIQTTQNACTSQEYLNCANGCDPTTGRCRVVKEPTTGINASTGVTVQNNKEELSSLEVNSLIECMGKGVWIQNQCWPAGTTLVDVNTRASISNADSCTKDSQCQSGSCKYIPGKFGSVCTPNVDTIGGSSPRFASGISCKASCASEGGDEKTCSTICSQYNTSDENLLAVGQAINTLTGGTFADYVATNIELNNEGLQGIDRYLDPRALEANTKFGLVLTAEGALAYTGVGALTGAGSAATFGATANLVNTGYSAYQAQQACSGTVTPEEKQNCAIAVGYAALASANLVTSGLSLAAQGADDLARAAQFANQARIANGIVSTAEIGANAYQTYNVCTGPNSNTTECLAQAGLTGLHAVGSFSDIAYTANQTTNYVNQATINSVSGLEDIFDFRPSEYKSIQDIYGWDYFENPLDQLVMRTTGYSLAESESLVNYLSDYHLTTKVEYGLPPIDMKYQNPSEYIRRLEQIAAREGITIKPYTEYAQFFAENLSGGVYNNNLNAVVVKPTTIYDPIRNLIEDASTLEHEIIHGLQHTYKPSMPIEFMELEAYLTANVNPARIIENSDLLEAVFGSINYSTNFWYRNEGLIAPWMIQPY